MTLLAVTDRSEFRFYAAQPRRSSVLMRSLPSASPSRASACLTLLVAVSSLGLWAAETAPATVLQRTLQAPVIDGRLDDACWAASPAVLIDQPNAKNQPRADVPPAIARYAWDEHYLYIGYETFDRNLVAVGTGEVQGPPDNQREGCVIWKKDEAIDVVEFFISLGDRHFFWELHHNALNQFNDVWCVATDPEWPIHRAAMNPYGILFHLQEYLQDDGSRTVSMAVTLKPKDDGSPSTVGGGDVDSGYFGEMRIPWRGLGVERERAVKGSDGAWQLDGLTIAVLAVVQDGDLKHRYHRSGPYGASSWFHLDMPAWPRYQLSEVSE